MTELTNRYDFAFLFDVTNGNPNGDPDAGNLPRMDPETNLGLVTDVCLKRKVRNYVELARGADSRYAIYVQEGAVLNDQHRKAYRAVRNDPSLGADKKTKLSPKNDAEADELRKWMCTNFFDVRSFGAVMSTGINCGQVRGPIQFSFGRSIEAIMPMEISITRMAATNEAEKAKQTDAGDDERRENRTMGRKHIVPYGLYRAHGFVSAKLAQRTGFSTDDLALLWTALRDMFEHDRSAARGEMAARRLIVFKHQNELGNAPAHALFDQVRVWRKVGDERREPGDTRLDNVPPARRFADYEVELRRDAIPDTVEVVEMI